jgi:hypothetical protein
MRMEQGKHSGSWGAGPAERCENSSISGCRPKPMTMLSMRVIRLIDAYGYLREDQFPFL